MDAEVGGAVGRHQIQPGQVVRRRRCLVRERQCSGRGPGADRRRGRNGALARLTRRPPERVEAPGHGVGEARLVDQRIARERQGCNQLVAARDRHQFVSTQRSLTWGLAGAVGPTVSLEALSLKFSASCRSACVLRVPVMPPQTLGPAGPAGPWLPVAPGGPVAPAGPVAPVGPAGPVLPAVPGTPWGPWAPAGPWLPGGPAAPAGPSGPRSDNPRAPQDVIHSPTRSRLLLPQTLAWLWPQTISSKTWPFVRLR